MASKHTEFFKENSEDYHVFYLCVWKGLKHRGGREGVEKEKSTQASLSNTPFCQLALQVHELLPPLQAGAYVCASMMTLAPQPNYNKILLTGAMAPSMLNAFCLDHKFTLAQMLQIILSHKSS